jgi:hypothetical protein
MVSPRDDDIVMYQRKSGVHRHIERRDHTELSLGFNSPFLDERRLRLCEEPLLSLTGATLAFTVLLPLVSFDVPGRISLDDCVMIFDPAFAVRERVAATVLLVGFDGFKEITFFVICDDRRSGFPLLLRDGSESVAAGAERLSGREIGDGTRIGSGASAVSIFFGESCESVRGSSEILRAEVSLLSWSSPEVLRVEDSLPSWHPGGEIGPLTS